MVAIECVDRLAPSEGCWWQSVRRGLVPGVNGIAGVPTSVEVGGAGPTE